MCWSHIVKNIDRKLLEVRNKESKKTFRWTSDTLQLAKNPREFKNARAHFRGHHRFDCELTSFLDYIQDFGIDGGLGNWNEGFQHGSLSIYNKNPSVIGQGKEGERPSNMKRVIVSYIE